MLNFMCSFIYLVKIYFWSLYMTLIFNQSNFPYKEKVFDLIFIGAIIFNAILTICCWDNFVRLIQKYCVV